MMKRTIKIIFILLVTILIIDYSEVSAQVKTYDRSEDNLGVWDSIYVTDSNRQLILDTPKVNEKEKVYDFADLFSNEEEKELYESIQNYIDEYNMDMVIVTINENNKNSSMEYADDFYDYNYFGINDSKDGILFLIDMDKRNIYISTTGKAIDKYNDNRIDDMLDSAYEYMTLGGYFEAADAFIKEASSNHIPWILIFTLPILVATIPTVVFIFKNKMVRKKTEASQYIDKNGIKIDVKRDVFITTNTVRHVIESSSSGSSSTHSGSSGSSHGGGGRSF